MSDSVNDQLILLSGKSAVGKSFSLRGIEDPKGVLYLNCESGKKLPFKSQFVEQTIVDPLQIYEWFNFAETQPKCHTIVVDSLTFMMDMYESVHVLTATQTMQAWGQFAQFFKVLMQNYVARSTKNVIFTAHTFEPNTPGDQETYIQMKGSLKNNGIEAYFSLNIGAKKVPLRALAEYKNDLLTITPKEQLVGFKYVFQTDLTKETVNERLRGPIGLFTQQETYIDNNVQLVLNRLKTYYA